MRAQPMMQPNSFAMRIWGPLDDGRLSRDEWGAVAKVMAACWGPESANAPKVVESHLPNSEGIAVRQEERAKATVMSFPVSRTAAGRSAKARKSGIDILNVLGGDALAGPVADGLLREPQSLGESGLGDSLGVPGEYGGEGAPGTVCHGAPLIQEHLYIHKSDLCASGDRSQQNAPMASIPRPELFTSYSSWITAVLQVPGVTQKRLAEVCGCTQQSVASWKKGSRPKPEPLKKMAAWSGYDYQTLRMLVDDVPIPGTSRTRAQTRLRRDPEVEQIAAMLDQIADDEDGLRLARVLLQELVDQRQQLKKRRHA